jgi:integrase
MARRNPAIYTPEVTERVLRYVESHRPDLAPSFAIAFFAGIRPEELRRITPDELDFDSGEIRIPAEVSKTHQERLVTMSDNLLAWLVRHPPEAGKPLGATAPAVMHFRKGMREALGVDTPKDIARHCFATYYCALHGMDATAEQLGHESTAMLHRHYKGLARNRASAAARYFAIGPKPAEEATLLHLVSATA